MKKRSKFIFSWLVLMLVISGCQTMDDNVFQLKDSYVGDNSAVGDIANHLPGAEFLNRIELKTREEPYGIVLHFNWKGSEKEYQELVVHHATYFFTLIQNVDWVTFIFDNREYTVTKEQLQAWFGKELDAIQTEDELIECIRKLVELEKVSELFNK